MIQTTIALIKDFIEVQKPWKGTDDEKKTKFQLVLNQLCAIYHVSVPRLIFDFQNESLQRSHGQYNIADDIISLPKFSVVTFLHEFKHMVQAKKNLPNTEEIARGWSVSLFYLASPKAYKRAVEKGGLLFE